MKDVIIRNALDMGEQMLKSGGEVFRVEDTIERILKAYGFRNVNVFTITTHIQVSAEDEQGKVYSHSRRVYRWGTNLQRLEKLNQLSRDICREKPNPDIFTSMLRDILGTFQEKDSTSDVFFAYLGGVLAAGGFTVFFGGTMLDAVVTAVLAMMITWMDRHIQTNMGAQLLYYFFFSIVTGFVGSLLVHLGSGAGFSLHLDKILIGCIMLTIPGIAITFSVRDMLLGETITGLLRFVESLLIAASIAAGFVFSSMIIGGAV